MQYWRSLSRQGIWLSATLILALLMLLVFPAHLHIHHDSDDKDHAHTGSSVEHEIELGITGGPTDLDHHEDDHVIDISNDVMSRKATDPHAPVSVLFMLPSFSFLVMTRPGIRPVTARNISVRQFFLLSPPLRAPPAV